MLFIALTVYTLYITLIPVLLWLKKIVCASWLFVASSLVKQKQTNPKGKAKPKPKVISKPPPGIYYNYSSEDGDERQPVIKKKQKEHEVMSNQRVPQQNINPINALADYYHLL